MKKWHLAIGAVVLIAIIWFFVPSVKNWITSKALAVTGA